MKVTLDDIAKAANVSKSTVSKVLTNTDRISESTRERVLKIMKEMNYQSNMIARIWRGCRWGNIYMSQGK